MINRESRFGNHETVRGIQVWGTVTAEFLSKHIDIGWRENSHPYPVASNSNDSDGDIALGHDNPLADFPTQY